MRILSLLFLVLFAGSAIAQPAPGTNQTPRTKLTAATTFYVAASGGSDAATNNCRASTRPCATIQNAINLVANNYDLQCQSVTISLAAGSYSGTVDVFTPWVGACGNATNSALAAPVKIVGAGIASTTITTASGNTINIGSFSGPPTSLGVEAVAITGATGTGIQINNGSVLSIANPVQFNAAGGSHISCTRRGNIHLTTAAYTINGGAGVAHINMTQNCTMTVLNNPTVTVNGSYTYGGTGSAQGFIVLQQSSTANISAMTFSSTAGTGNNWWVSGNAVLSSGAITFPGSVGCVAGISCFASGGQKL